MKNFVVVKSMTNKNQRKLMSFTLPCPFHEPFVVATRYENFVFIIGGMKEDKQISDKWMVFTKKNGFRELNQFSIKDISI